MDRMTVGEFRHSIQLERQIALDTRDPIAIRQATERYDIFHPIIAGLKDEAIIDMEAITLDLTQAARAIGFNKKELKKQITDGRLPGKRINNEWRVAARHLF